MPEQPCCWGRGWCKTQNAHEARPRPSFRGQKAVSHVVWTQIPSIVLPPGQMAKCENCDSVHWQPQQSSVQVCEPETGVEKAKRKWLQRTGSQVMEKLAHKQEGTLEPWLLCFAVKSFNLLKPWDVSNLSRCSSLPLLFSVWVQHLVYAKIVLQAFRPVRQWLQCHAIFSRLDLAVSSCF